MTGEELKEEIRMLKEIYPEIEIAKGAAGEDMIRVKKAMLPRGCCPDSTPVLLVIREGQSKPEIYVKPGIKIPDGNDPRSVSMVQVGGEEWMQFSFTFSWDEKSNTLVQFVGSALRRFCKN